MDKTCTLTITFEKTTWENCCPDTTPETASASCPPILQTLSKCPTPYTNCADPSSHREMCSAELKDYSDSRSLNRKCCPAGYTCGSTYNAPCVLMAGNNATHGEEVRTNPQYLSKPGVFAGCNDASALSPAAVGGIVAVGVVSFCCLCGLLLWFIRRRLYRDPARRRYRRTGGRGAIAGVVGGISALGMGDTGITITREFKVEAKVEEDAAGMEGMEGMEAGRRSGDSTTRIVSEDVITVEGNGESGEPPLDGPLWVAGEGGRSEDTTTLIPARY